jgi:hypothetical protein
MGLATPATTRKRDSGASRPWHNRSGSKIPRSAGKKEGRLQRGAFPLEPELRQPTEGPIAVAYQIARVAFQASGHESSDALGVIMLSSEHHGCANHCPPIWPPQMKAQPTSHSRQEMRTLLRGTRPLGCSTWRRPLGVQRLSPSRGDTARKPIASARSKTLAGAPFGRRLARDHAGSLGRKSGYTMGIGELRHDP